MKAILFILIAFMCLSCDSDPLDDEIGLANYPFLGKTFRPTKSYYFTSDGNINQAIYFKSNPIVRIEVYEIDSMHVKNAYNPSYDEDTIENPANLYLGWKSWEHSVNDEYILTNWGYHNQSDTLYYTFNNDTLLWKQRFDYYANGEPWIFRYHEAVIDNAYTPVWDAR